MVNVCQLELYSVNSYLGNLWNILVSTYTCLGRSCVQDWGSPERMCKLDFPKAAGLSTTARGASTIGGPVYVYIYIYLEPAVES